MLKLKFKLCAFCVGIASIFTLFLFGCGDDNGTNPVTDSDKCTQWSGWSVRTAATCEADGDSIRTCQTAGVDSTDVRVIARLTGEQCGGGSGGDGSCTYTGETVRIGNLTWMAENLNCETANSWCYDDSPNSCARYGRLYTWDAAMSACPSGWRLPTNADWDNLMTSVGGSLTAGTKLKSKTGWNGGGNGTDEFGFSALPGGCRFTDGSFRRVGGWGSWWSAAENDVRNARVQHMVWDYNHVRVDWYNQGYGFSIRCVKD